ncbi:NUDIX hydrolase [Streptacidiphilus sp. P02-A3a]|uniref:NUDIX domain-containing protein n=1 Tax=Streptacidiphilus sp. P02-A3a TaxID=2704468 RepID=UPI0015FABC34|nr:NUDIX hydrolase [Streptacidiphilus sp. P02-A3a]QMU67195.1 NUDIX hydrolase [Streptacidiphilus sp. P02-A3a]
MAAGAVIRDHRGWILLVKPIYKEGWEIPGGVVEADESPLMCCAREIREELGVSAPIGELIALDWRGPCPGKEEIVVFVFDGGILPEEAAAELRLPPDELSTWCFVAPEDLARYLPGGLAVRVTSAVDPLLGVYLEQGLRPERAGATGWV